MVRRLNIDGDGQGDLVGHGGEHRAVLVYQTESYRYWQSHLGRNDFTYGEFGENFTVDGLPDDQVCIGDRYRIGRALFEVTQPRVTCYRVGIRLNQPDMAALLVSHRRPGFYLRVLEEGEVGQGDEIAKVEDGPERITVADIDALLYLPGHPDDQLRRAMRIPALSPGWKQSFRALLDRGSDATASAGNAALSEVAISPPAWQGFRLLRVARVEQECNGVVSLSFEPTDDVALPPALPGQFVVLKLRTKPDTPPLLRNYSISNAPGERTYRVSIKRETNGAASSFLHDFVHVRDTLDVSAPRGGFLLRDGSRPVILMSAGIGATPVLAMLHALVAQSTARKVWWIFGARDKSVHPFARESRNLVNQLVDARHYVAYSAPGPAEQFGVDYDLRGRLSITFLDQISVPKDADFYLCGPSSFLHNFQEGLRQRGTPSSQIHAEIFGPGESMTPGIAGASGPPAHVPEGTPGTGPQIWFARSGLRVPFSSSFKNLLEFAEACDVPVKWSCRTGVCHLCESGLIGGEVSYDPVPLEAPAPGYLLLCCAQPKGDLEIDL